LLRTAIGISGTNKALLGLAPNSENVGLSCVLVMVGFSLVIY
jgi:hypothetical protein